MKVNKDDLINKIFGNMVYGASRRRYNYEKKNICRV